MVYVDPVMGLPPAQYEGYTPLPGVIPPCPPPKLQKAHWWGGEEKCQVTANQPIIPVPVCKEIHKTENIVEVEQTIVTDKVVPKLHHQEVFHEVPKVVARVEDIPIPLKQLEIIEKTVEITIPVGFNFNMESNLNVREVPRIYPKYMGRQQIIPIGVPQVQIIDKRVEKEIPLFVGQKEVEKEIIQDVGVETVQYKYVKKEEEVPVYKYRPVFDVEVSIPPPVIVPIQVQPEEKATTTRVMTYQQYKAMKKQRGLLGAICQGICDCCKCRTRDGRTLCERCAGKKAGVNIPDEGVILNTDRSAVRKESPPGSPRFSPAFQRPPVRLHDPTKKDDIGGDTGASGSDTDRSGGAPVQ